jgi:iron-sulfur cluster repair protein YtfE (RIC family)
MGRDPFDALIADHRRFIALLRDMEQSQSRGRSAFHRAQLLLRLKRGLAAHALAEEDVVYPLLHDEAKAIEETKHLYDEHADMKIHLHALEQMPKDAPEWTARARALRQLVEEHARQEEDVDFPKLRRALSEQAAARLSSNLQREKALIL